jgi:predicted DNA-binding transcriptional regulator AlpA
VALAEILRQFERRAAEAEAVGATAPVASVYQAVLTELRPLAEDNGKRVSVTTLSPGDRLLTVEETAPLLGVAPRWLYRHANGLPFTRHLSRKALRFSEAGLRRWLETRR